MTKLTDILIEALKSDAEKSNKAKSYINKIKSLINSYRSDNKEIKVGGIGQYSYIEIYFGDLTIKIIPSSNGQTHARFEPKTAKTGPLITVYNTPIKRDPKLSAEFDEQDLYHELVHYLDYENIKTDPDKLNKGYEKNKAKGHSGYINNPLEVNAHFFEFFMPEVVKYIEKEKDIPETFDEFKNGLLKDPKAKEFIDDLDDKNKKKVMKRLGTYYTEILTNPKLEIEKDGEVDTSKLKKITNTFITRLKSVLKAA